MDCFVAIAPRNDEKSQLICPTGKSVPLLIFRSPAPLAKIFPLTRRANQIYNSRRLVPLEGRLAIVTDAGRDAVDAGGAKDEGAARGRRSRGPDAPTLASSWRKRFR
jgi:hypothetical protein